MTLAARRLNPDEDILDDKKHAARLESRVSFVNPQRGYGVGVGAAVEVGAGVEVAVAVGLAVGVGVGGSGL